MPAADNVGGISHCRQLNGFCFFCPSTLIMSTWGIAGLLPMSLLHFISSLGN